MLAKTDVLCSGGCGKVMDVRRDSGASPTCHPCRRVQLQAQLDAVPPCEICGERMTDAYGRAWIKGEASLPPKCRPCRRASHTHRGNCSQCGKKIYVNHTSLPEPVCQSCRRDGMQRKYRRGTCTKCGSVMSEAKSETPICQPCRRSMSEQIVQAGERECFTCGITKPLSQFGFNLIAWREGKGLGSGTCYSCQARRHPANRMYARLLARRKIRAETWDGVTDGEILDRDWWDCQMPNCLRAAGREIPQVAWPDPWSASIDHVLPVHHGGAETADNKRAAHLRCNVARGTKLDEDDLLLLKDAPSLYKAAQAAREAQLAEAAAARETRAVREAQERAARPQHPRWPAETAEQAYRMRQEGLKWQEISDRLGLGNTGMAYYLAARHGPVKDLGSSPRGRRRRSSGTSDHRVECDDPA